MIQEGFSDISLTYENKVARIIINRPDKLNAIRVNTYFELISAFQAADSSPECHVISLEGKGGQFSAGNDLADLIGAEKDQVLKGVQGIFDCVASLKKVLVASVEGVAVGIGTTILLHCDIVVASNETRFRLPFTNLGVCPEGGSSFLLPQAIGEKRARELLLTGRFFTAEEAYRWGLINAISEPGKTQQDAADYITLLLKQPLASLIATKELLKISREEVSKVVASELSVFSQLLETRETQGRIAALLKR